MKALQYKLELKSNVLIPRVASGDPNSYSSLLHIPGSVLRGVAIKRLIEVGSGDALRPIFFDSDLCFLHAYPQVGDNNTRSLPTPLSWRTIKDQEYEILNLSAAIDEYEEFQLEKVNAPFSFLFELEEERQKYEAGAYLISPEDWFSLHIQRPRNSNGEREQSQMFRYHSLYKGQDFIGYIISEDSDLLETIQSLLGGIYDVSIGRSHKAEYGRATLTISGEVMGDWKEVTSFGSNDNTITITCLSDVLLRDPNNGSYTTNLEPMIGMKPLHTFATTTMVGGYNRKWNLPLPQAQAIRAGSVFVFDKCDDIKSVLESFQKRGLGERTSEGFGRVAINWQDVDPIKIKPLYETPPTDQRDEYLLDYGNDTSDGLLATRIVENIFNARIKTNLTEKINAVSITKAPTNAQIARLCAVLEQALRGYANDNNLVKAQEKINIYFNSFRRPAKEQFDNAKVDSKKLEEWVLEKVSAPGNIWSDPLGIAEDELPEIGNKQVILEKLAFRYTILYIDGALRHEIKRRKKEAGHE